MPDQKISALASLAAGSVVPGDLLEIVDISDTTMAASGTNKRIDVNNLRAATGGVGGVLYMHPTPR